MDYIKWLPRAVRDWVIAARARQKRLLDQMDERTMPYNRNFDGPDDNSAACLVPSGDGKGPVVGRSAAALPLPKIEEAA